MGKAVIVMALTAKQKRFCDEYLIDFNATQAAIRAGYSERTAYSQGQRLLKNVEVQKYLQERMAEKEKELIADQNEVMKYLSAVMRREKTESVVVTLSKEKSVYVPDANGTMRKQTVKEEIPQVVEIPARLSDANKAAELLGKAYGIYTDKVDMDENVPVIFSGEDQLEE